MDMAIRNRSIMEPNPPDPSTNTLPWEPIGKESLQYLWVRIGIYINPVIYPKMPPHHSSITISTSASHPESSTPTQGQSKTSTIWTNPKTRSNLLNKKLLGSLRDKGSRMKDPKVRNRQLGQTNGSHLRWPLIREGLKMISGLLEWPIWLSSLIWCSQF